MEKKIDLNTCSKLEFLKHYFGENFKTLNEIYNYCKGKEDMEYVKINLGGIGGILSHKTYITGRKYIRVRLDPSKDQYKKFKNFQASAYKFSKCNFEVDLS